MTIQIIADGELDVFEDLGAVIKHCSEYENYLGLIEYVIIDGALDNADDFICNVDELLSGGTNEEYFKELDAEEKRAN
jgi:hypothetical protein